MISFIGFIGCIILGIYAALHTIGASLINDEKIKVKVIFKSICLDIIFCFIAYSLMPTNIALMLLNTATIKFIVLSIIDYEMLGDTT